MIDTTKLKINSTQKLPPMPDPYQQQPMAQTQQVQQAPPQPAGQDWQNFDWMKGVLKQFGTKIMDGRTGTK
jgi:hypothetical protein